MKEDNLLESLFPIGEERWVKVKYLDLEKCIRNFNIGPNEEKKKEISDDIGFECTAIGIRPEYTPQISAIMDLKDDVIQSLLHILDEYELERINRIFKDKIDELKERTIRENGA
jgi:hypothetical protein